MKNNKEYFESKFNNYSDKFGNAWGMNWRAYMMMRAKISLSRINDIIQDKDCKKILEIGCASGDFLNGYVNAVAEDRDKMLIATDISDNAVSICREKFSEHNNVSFETMALPDVTYNDVDLIICVDVLEYFDINEKQECLKWMREALSERGQMVLQSPLGYEDDEAFINFVNENFAVMKQEYIWGKVWFDWFEKRLCYLVDLFLKDEHEYLGWFGKLIGKAAFKILGSEFLVSFFCKINFLFFRNKKSHIIWVLKRQE